MRPVGVSESPLNVRSLLASTVSSTYFLIDCWVASASSLLDDISSSSRIDVIPTKFGPGFPISNWFIVAIPVITISLPLSSS